MSDYRASYKKTMVLAVAAGTVSLLISAVILLTDSIGIPWTEIKVSLHPVIVWIGGLFLVGVALFGFAVALGGLLALHNDTKGRAYF